MAGVERDQSQHKKHKLHLHSKFSHRVPLFTSVESSSCASWAFFRCCSGVFPYFAGAAVQAEVIDASSNNLMIEISFFISSSPLQMNIIKPYQQLKKKVAQATLFSTHVQPEINPTDCVKVHIRSINFLTHYF